MLKIKKNITNKIVVVDNGSIDNTPFLVKKAGIVLISEPRQGYGHACLAGIRYLNSLKNPPSYVLFFDADGQCLVEDIVKVAHQVIIHQSNYCQGSRMLLKNAKNSLSRPAMIANLFFSSLLEVIWRQEITDLGPLRCISLKTLNSIDMQSTGYGWTIEMSTKILKANINHIEVAVDYRKRIYGKSKISGNFWSALNASAVMSLQFLKVLLFWKGMDNAN